MQLQEEVHFHTACRSNRDLHNDKATGTGDHVGPYELEEWGR
jgi:hypothetical protein